MLNCNDLLITIVKEPSLRWCGCEEVHIQRELSTGIAMAHLRKYSSVTYSGAIHVEDTMPKKRLQLQSYLIQLQSIFKLSIYI